MCDDYSDSYCVFANFNSSYQVQGLFKKYTTTLSAFLLFISTTKEVSEATLHQNETLRPSSKDLDSVINHLNPFLCNISDFCHCSFNILTSLDLDWNSDLTINGDLRRKHLQPTHALQKRTKQCCNYLYCNVCLHRWDGRMARSMYLPWRHLRLGLQIRESVNGLLFPWS
jgi:hypothetical protein